MNKKFNLPLLMLALGVSTMLVISSCSKGSSNTPSPDPALIKLLVGTPGMLWQLDNGVYGIPFVICDCVKKHNHLIFNADGTFSQAAYTCNAPADTMAFFSFNGNSGQWSLAGDNIKLTLAGTTYNLVSVTATALVIDVLYNGSPVERLNYISVNSAPFLPLQNRIQQLCNVTWKYSKLNVNKVDQTLTPDLVAERFKYDVTGNMSTSFTNTAYGLPFALSWTLYQDQSTPSIRLYNIGTPTVPSVNNFYGIMELTETSFIYNYYNAGNNTTTISYLVPQ